MEEKKLTDEEIVKALECCKQKGGEDTCKYCYTCPASVWDFEDGITECNVDLFQKAINLIHRLQSEKAELKAENESFCKTINEASETIRKKNDRIVEQKAEIERLTEENGQLKGYNSGLKYENTELQKQVDELMSKRIEPLIIQCHTPALETCPKVKQAVKDTAREILQAVDNESNGQTIAVTNALRKRYGVEVE